jgi:hypothetical protein
MKIPPPQEMQSVDPRDYEVRIIVAGSRNYADRREFHDLIVSYIERFDVPILFISGKAPTGADDLIIRWCKKFKYPCAEYPANWDDGVGDNVLRNRAAGHQRNYTMSLVGTHLLAFFNGTSPGTAGMIDVAMKKRLLVKIINVTIP